MADRAIIHKLICEYRFKPSLSFFDARYQIGNTLLRDYKHWETDGNNIRLTNFKNHSALVVESNRLVLEMDVPESKDAFGKLFSRALKEYTKAISIDEFRRLGIRTQSMIQVDFTFDELVKVTHSKFHSQDKALIGAIGGETKDFMYNVVTEKNKCVLHLISGPVREEELPRWFTPTKVTVSPGEKAKPIDFPSVAVFIDCDFYLNDPAVEQIDSFLTDGLSKVYVVPDQLKSYLFGDK